LFGGIVGLLREIKMKLKQEPPSQTETDEVHWALYELFQKYMIYGVPKSTLLNVLEFWNELGKKEMDMLESLKYEPRMKPILTREENVNIYLKNFMQLGEALMNAGGNSFLILKKYDEFLRTLAANNISVTAKYDGPEFKNKKIWKSEMKKWF
jgi:hypothetical protein